MNQIEDIADSVPATPIDAGKRTKRQSKSIGKHTAPTRAPRAAKAVKRQPSAPGPAVAAASREQENAPPPSDLRAEPEQRTEQSAHAPRGPSIIGALRQLRAAATAYLRPATTDPVQRQEERHVPAVPTTEPSQDTMPLSKGPTQRARRVPTPAHTTPQEPADTVPAALRVRYLVVDDKFYFRDREQTLAFEDQGKRIATVHDDAEVAQSMVALAQAKGWTGLKLRGSEEFKREAWLAAALQGMEVSGYRPSDLDKARLAERQSERAQDTLNSIQRTVPLVQPPVQAEPSATQPTESVPAEDAATKLGKRQQRAIDALAAYLRQRGDSEQAVGMTVAIASEQMLQRRAHFGKLVEHGEAPYKNDPDQESSYFVTLQTDRGRQTIWGVDLARAVGDSGVAIGDDILLSKRGARDVTVPVIERDQSGRPVGGKTYLDTHRNDWEVSSLDGAKAFVASQGKAGQAAPAPALPPALDPQSQAASAQKPSQRLPEPELARTR